MRRTVIVLIVSTVLFWGSAALASRLPTGRLDGDPDEYQQAAVHDEKCVNVWNPSRRAGGHERTSEVALEPAISSYGVTGPEAWRTSVPGFWVCGSWIFRVPQSRDLGGLLWEVLFPGKKQRYSGEGR